MDIEYDYEVKSEPLPQLSLNGRSSDKQIDKSQRLSDHRFVSRDFEELNYSNVHKLYIDVYY